MTDSEIVRAFARRRAEERLALACRRRDLLRSVVPDLARRLVREFGARRVILFGSLAWGQADEDSDIDLAVEGLPVGSFFKALGEVLADAPAPVDLVELEIAPQGLRERILRDGVAIDV